MYYQMYMVFITLSIYDWLFYFSLKSLSAQICYAVEQPYFKLLWFILDIQNNKSCIRDETSQTVNPFVQQTLQGYT